MKTFDLRYYTAGAYVAVAMLAGCGGSQPPIGAPGETRSTAIAQHAAHGKFWMLREAKSEDLHYVTDLTA